MKMLLFFVIFFSTLAALEIDIDSFEQEAINNPKNIKVRVILARAYIEEKNYNKAQSILNEILKIDPKNKKAITLMSKLTRKKSPKLTQEQNYKNILSKHDDVDTAINLYNLYLKKGKKDQAKRLKMRYWRKSLNNPIYIALQKQDDDRVFNRAKKLEKIYKKSHRFKDFLSYYYEMEGLGYKDKGFKKLKEFVKNNNSNEEAVLFLANQYYWNGKTKKSLNTLKPIIDNKTNNIDILKLNANLLYQTGKNKEALKEFNKIVSLGAGDKDVLKNIKSIKNGKSVYISRSARLKIAAEKYYLKKRYKRAVLLYKKYFKRVSHDNTTRFHYASSLEQLKRYKNAEKQYRIVRRKNDKLYDLATYRYAKTLMAQKDESKWEQARVVLTNLLEKLSLKDTKQSNDILKYTQQSLEIVSQPMPKATKYKDIMLTESQSKILDPYTFAGSQIQKQYVSSIKGMLNPNLSSISYDKTIQASAFTTMLNDQNIQNRGYGITLANQNFSLTTKKSTFKNDINNTKLDVNTLRASYSNRDNFSISLGVNNFENSTDLVGKIEFRNAYKNHNITYGLGYENGIFINGSTCSVKNGIDVISLSLYDIILLKNLEEAEATFVINSFSDSNLNINSWVNYPLYRKIMQDLETTFSLAGSYEYNSKEDTCYNASRFFDTTQIELKSQYKFSSGYVELKGSVGYSAENSDTVYSYGFLLQVSTGNSLDLSVDCRHYQSGYSPDGADECYISFSKVW